MRLFSILSLFLTLVVGGVANAQESPYEKFDVYIYPEYDHPGVGIFIEIDTKTGEFPRYLEMDVPDETTIVLLHDRTAGTSNRIEISQRDGKNYLGVDISKPKMAVQYYYNPYDSTSHREIEFSLVLNDPLPEYHIIVQQPMSAVNFKHSMVGAEVLDGDWGLQFFRSHNQGYAPGEQNLVTISYENTTGELTAPQIQAKQDAGEIPITQSTPTSSDGPTTNFTVVMGIFMGLAILIVILIWIFGPDKTAAKATPKTSASKTVSTPKSGKFCTNCGAPKSATSKFCTKCGKES